MYNVLWKIHKIVSIVCWHLTSLVLTSIYQIERNYSYEIKFKPQHDAYDDAHAYDA